MTIASVSVTVIWPPAQQVSVATAGVQGPMGPMGDVTPEVEAAQTASELARDRAQEWAENPEDLEVDPINLPGSYSALHWAAKADDAAQTAQAARDDAATAKGLAEAARSAAEFSATSAAGSANNADQSRQAAASHASAAMASRSEAQDAQGAAEAARDLARDWASAPENIEVEPGKYSALHHAAKAGQSEAAAQGSATDAQVYADDASASALLAETLAAGSELRGAVGTLSAVLGQTQREVERLSAAQEGDVYTLRTLLEALSLIGQLADQINGGHVALRGGSLADPALRIGTAGIYSSAADTLSVAIAGVERLRVTATGITVYGTVTEA